MNIKKILFPFSDHKESLKTKWWHRLFVVAFAFLIFLGVLSAIGGTVAGGGIGHFKLNSKILATLNSFTANQDSSITDTVTLFTEEYSNIGCLEDSGKISWLSTYTLEDKAFCSADVRSNLSDIADQMIESGGLASYGLNATQRLNRKNNLIEGLEGILAEDTEKRYCFVQNDLECSSHNVVAYRPNILFYVGGLVISLLGLYLFSLFLQLIYFKGLVYIVYGKENDNPEKKTEEKTD